MPSKAYHPHILSHVLKHADWRSGVRYLKAAEDEGTSTTDVNVRGLRKKMVDHISDKYSTKFRDGWLNRFKDLSDVPPPPGLMVLDNPALRNQVNAVGRYLQLGLWKKGNAFRERYNLSWLQVLIGLMRMYHSENKPYLDVEDVSIIKRVYGHLRDGGIGNAVATILLEVQGNVQSLSGGYIQALKVVLRLAKRDGIIDSHAATRMQLENLIQRAEDVGEYELIPMINKILQRERQEKARVVVAILCWDADQQEPRAVALLTRTFRNFDPTDLESYFGWIQLNKSHSVYLSVNEAQDVNDAFEMIQLLREKGFYPAGNDIPLEIRQQYPLWHEWMINNKAALKIQRKWKDQKARKLLERLRAERRM
jgi:hypothetical protein